MDLIFNLIMALFALLTLSLILVMSYILLHHKNKPAEPKTPLPSKIKKVDFSNLKDNIYNSSASAEELAESVDLLIKKFIKIENDEKSNEYVSMIAKLCTHPNVDSETVIQLDKELRKANPRYARIINEAVKNGLQRRRK